MLLQNVANETSRQPFFWYFNRRPLALHGSRKIAYVYYNLLLFWSSLQHKWVVLQKLNFIKPRNDRYSSLYYISGRSVTYLWKVHIRTAHWQNRSFSSSNCWISLAERVTLKRKRYTKSLITAFLRVFPRQNKHKRDCCKWR